MGDQPKKIRWADIEDDEDDLPLPQPQVTKHGVKVAYVPPHLRAEKKCLDRPKKTKPLETSKKR